MDERIVGDWEAKRERFVAWWARELEEPLVAVTAARPRPLFKVPDHAAPDDLERRWCNPEPGVHGALRAVASTWFGGDAVPVALPYLGPVALAGFAGAELAFMPETVWVKPRPGDLRAWHTPEFDPQNEYVRITEAKTHALLEAAEGRWFVAPPDLTDGVTMLSQMRGQVEFCRDLRDCPEEVRRLRDGMIELWLDAYEHFTRIHRKAGQDGVADWVGLWGPRYCCVQCDFSALIGPQDFDWLVLPEQAKETAIVNQSIYHLDGPNEIVHLPRLLDLRGLDAIQWIQGAGKPGALHWIALEKTVLKSGKNLLLYVGPGDVAPLLEALPHRGLALVVHGVASEEEARALLRAAKHPLA
jgi:5-methyltetrahydrofolate--homocysteine methyltransferase